MNRLSLKSYPDTSTVNYTYDNDSRLTQVTDPTGTYQFTFDNMGRLTGTSTQYTVLTSRAFATSYGYDAASNRTSFTDPENGSSSYVYDTLNRLQTLTPPTAYGTGSFGLGYDALSRRTSLTRPNTVNTTYGYDNLSRLLSVTHAKGGVTLDGATYTVDNAGNRTAKSDLYAGGTTNYGYDNIYELLNATQGGSTTESYTYDPVGNRLTALGSATWSYNTSNELNSRPGASYAFDANGNTIVKTDGTGSTSYTWDFENRLGSVTLPGAGGTVTFKYDPFGRRIYKSSSSGTSVYAYDGDNLVEETNATGGVVARYSQGLNIDEPLAMLRSSATSYYQADGLGSVTSLTNTAGTAAQNYTYDSFGNIIATTGSLVNSFRYTGREWDTETSLYYYRARYYDPNSGRFASEDPIGFGSGQNNFYSYVANSPLGNLDPWGLARCTYIIGGLGGQPGPNGRPDGILICLPDDPRHDQVIIPVASGNNGDSAHHCKNNPNCQPDQGHGPLSPGSYQWGGDSLTHKRLGGKHLFPIPGTGTSSLGADGRFLTHWCKDPFGPSLHPYSDGHYCSEGCVTGMPDDIQKLNRLLNAEPGSTLLVVPGPFQM